MIQNKRIRVVVLFLLFLFVTSVPLFFHSYESEAASKSIKIRYNGKTYKNKSKKMNVRYNNKKVSNNSYKALIIKKNYMVSYADVFKKGVKAKCTYNKKKKALTISTNGATLKMTVGKRKATLNGKKVTLPVAPLSVRFVSKKKTKILVPINYVAKKLHLSYKKSGSTIYLGAPLYLNYDNRNTYYTGVQGKIFYNHKLYTPSTIPVIKISGKMYVPAEETLKNIMKWDYDYNPSTKTITATNEDVNLDFSATIGSTNARLNDKTISLTAPAKIITNNKTKKSVVCIPVATVMSKLNYTCSWNKSNKYYQIQSKNFFLWKKSMTASQSTNTTTNHLHEFTSTYKETNGMGAITFKLTGTITDGLKTTTVNRNGNTITVTIPKAKYLLDKNQFNNFGEIIQKMDVVEKDNNVVISFTCESVADFSYVTQSKTLELSILYTYSNSDGSSINYSLSIKKPAGISIANVSNEDLYKSKKFKIIIAGDHVAFYQKNPIIINNSNIKSLTVSKSGNNTIITIATASLMGYKIYESGNTFLVKIGSPKKVYKNIVVLDAGHGGKDPGAQNKGTNEKDLTHKILYTLMKQYFSGNAPDIKVYWTRTSDTYVTLANRAAFAKSVGADVFISLHMNSANSSSANGTEVYYSVSNNSTGFSGITSQKMANLFRTQLINDLKTKNRGTKTAAYYVLKHNTVPSILIELGFLSGSSDYSKLTNATFQKNAAKSIYTGIVSMFNKYKTGR